MKSKAVSGTILTLLFMGMLPLAFNIQPVEANPITIVVPDDYEKIQWAVGNASSGDTVFVRAGTYYENVFVSKTVSLIGENKNTTIIDGAGTTIIDGLHYFGGIFVFADDVKIANFTVRNGSYGILIRGDHIIGNRVTVTDCVAYNNRVGLEMFQSSQNLLRRNLLFNNSYNLHIGEFWHINEFLHDIDTSNLVNGKPVYYLANKKNVSINPVSFPNIGYLGVVNSTNVRISDLSISRNGEGLLIAFSSDILIERIEATNNFDGIALSGSSRTTIRHCNFSYNCARARYGIFAYYSDYVNIEENTISHNDGGIFLIGLNYGATYHNNFVENGLSPGFYQARTEQSYNCQWDNGYPSGGNYWSDYTGVDVKSGPNQDQPSSDGIGDTAYIIDENNRDRYPLMYAGPFHQLTVTTSPTTGIPFTINGAPKPTPYTEWLLEGSYTLEMPETHNGYVWSHWLEDGDTNRIKTILLQGTTWTAVYDHLPVACVLDCPKTVERNTPVSFDSTCSYDDLGIVAWEWDFGDPYDPTKAYTSIASHTFMHPVPTDGVYYVTLTIWDTGGNNDTATCQVNVFIPVGGEAKLIALTPTIPMSLRVGLALIIVSLVATVVYIKKRKRNTQINS